MNEAMSNFATHFLVRELIDSMKIVYLTDIHHLFSAIYHPLLANHHHFLTFHHPLPAIHRPFSAVHHPSLALHQLLPAIICHLAIHHPLSASHHPLCRLSTPSAGYQHPSPARQPNLKCLKTIEYFWISIFLFSSTFSVNKKKILFFAF